MPFLIILSSLLINSFLFFSPVLAQPVYQAHTNVDLVSDTSKVAPGTLFWVGLRLRMDNEWHVYWKNPGDSGLPASIKWTLPEDFAAGDIQWPYPSRINVGPLTSFGYEHEVILWTPIEVAAIINGETFDVHAQVKWLTCKVDCIPGTAELTLTFPVIREPSQENAEGSQALAKSRLLWPTDKSSWTIRAVDHPENITLEFSPNTPDAVLRGVVFFPDSDKLIEHAVPQELKPVGRDYQLTLKKSHLLTKMPASISGVLVRDEAWDDQGMYHGLTIDVPLESGTPFVPASAAAAVPLTLALACLFAFAGGIILNFMPCVLPVLSLKIIGLVKSARDRRKILVSGFLFVIGVVVSFWVLAGALIALQSAGQKLGWGFQFQSPVFVAAIASVLFVLALNMLGVFEIGVSLTTAGQGLPSTGYAGSFWSGVLATVVATPCTAPFMGTAIGFALAQPPVTALFIFTFLGLGMATPYFLLCAFPQALRFVPKPGPWMIGLKAFFGFVLLACVVWLAWVLGLQRGLGAVGVLFIGLCSAALGLWFWGFIQKGKTGLALKFLAPALIVAGLFAAVGGAALIRAPAAVKTAQSQEASGIRWREFSPELLVQLRSEGKPVFVDFTAAWCLTCQVNDRLVFQNKKVVEIFQELGIIALKADWTNHDETITKTLADYGKNSIPVYALYADRESGPVFLPEVVTPDIVINTLRQAVQGR